LGEYWGCGFGYGTARRRIPLRRYGNGLQSLNRHTAPLAGEYRCDATATVYNRSTGTGSIGVANPTTPAFQTSYTSSGDQFGVHSISQTLTATAAAVLTLKFAFTATSDINFYRASTSVSITPIRVG